MKQFLLILLIPLMFSCSLSEKDEGVLHNKRVLIFGNSITQNGAYVTYIEYFLRKNYPEQKLDIISIGLSSETVNGASEANHPYPRPCVHTRLDSALAMVQPDVVMACYGMNDGIYTCHNKEIFETYKKGIYKLNDKVKASGAQLILLTPTLFDPGPQKDNLRMEHEEHSYRNPYYKYIEVLDEFTNWLLSINDDGLKVIDLHNFLQPILADAKSIKEDSTFIPDGVHPNKAGHFLMAKKVLLDLYPQVEMGNPYPTVKQLASDSLFILVEKRRKLRSKGWLEYVGYIKKDTVKIDDIVPTKLKVEELDKMIEELEIN
ncbi:SGNH/GDSL hydrolase family protein [Saccharicrinis sp. GN24d3]|uniref:SGNH/GDSL hydrolase family protein n=1 Tax=Saccharicrinis sp. GN24d3 TaxID=3458416 RepID=UPI004036F23B